MRLGYLIAFVLGAVAMVAIQGRTQSWVVGSGLAFHLGEGHHCNEHVTPGFGIETGDYAFGVYSNSNCNTSYYAAKVWTPLRFGQFKFGTLGGAVTGYDAPILPVGGLVAAWEGEKYGVDLLFVPPVGSSGNVAWLQWKVRW